MTNLPTIVFMGTPEFARVIAEHLYAANFPILAVFAQPDKPVGRGQNLASPPVAVFAKEVGLPLFQPEKIREAWVLQKLSEFNPDFLVVAAYGALLPEAVLKTPKIASINVHASLLPDYRGAAPIQRAILQGDPVTGISIMQMAVKLDAGPVYSSQSLPITAEDTTPTLTQKLAALGAKLLCESLPAIASGSLKAKEQDHARATYAAKITKDMARIDWNNSAQQIANQIRAFLPWPVAETQISGMRLRLYAASVLPTRTSMPAGTLVHIAEQGLTVSTGFGDLLLQECQAEGKKRGLARDVANGLRLKVGDLFL